MSFLADGIVYAFEAVINVVIVAVGGLVALVFTLLPTISDAPVIGTPTWLGWVSWFFPVGDLVAGLTAAVGLWLAFLVLRYVLRVVRAL